MHIKRKKAAPKHESFAALLQKTGLRPTRQRLALSAWLFDGSFKHITAEEAHRAMQKARVRLSLATVYNTLNKFTETGLLRQVLVDKERVYFDTNTGDHHHILDERNGDLTDIPASSIRLANLPKLPRGTHLSFIDIILRVNSDA